MHQCLMSFCKEGKPGSHGGLPLRRTLILGPGDPNSLAVTAHGHRCSKREKRAVRFYDTKISCKGPLLFQIQSLYT